MLGEWKISGQVLHWTWSEYLVKFFYILYLHGVLIFVCMVMKNGDVNDHCFLKNGIMVWIMKLVFLCSFFFFWNQFLLCHLLLIGKCLWALVQLCAVGAQNVEFTVCCWLVWRPWTLHWFARILRPSYGESLIHWGTVVWRTYTSWSDAFIILSLYLSNPIGLVLVIVLYAGLRKSWPMYALYAQ